MAYYHSKFSLPEPRLSSLDQAMKSLEEPEGQQVRQGRLLLRPTNTLNVHRMVTGGTPSQRPPNDPPETPGDHQ